MKYFKETTSLILFLAASCSHFKSTKKTHSLKTHTNGTKEGNFIDYSSLDLNSLIEKENLDPTNPYIKKTLANKYFCQQKRGLAWEHVNWIQNFSNVYSLKNWANKTIEQGLPEVSFDCPQAGPTFRKE